jgi:hypothetical protein
MIRKPLKMFGLVCAAVFALSTMAEAAPKKVLHHRVRHSTRVSASRAIAAKKAIHRKKSRTVAKRAVHHRASTKPR